MYFVGKSVSLFFSIRDSSARMSPLPYPFICVFHLMLFSERGLYFDSHPDYRRLNTSTSKLVY